MEHVFLVSDVLSVILEPGALFSWPAAREHVFVLMIIRSVLMLGRRTLVATTPQASLSRRFMLRVALGLGWKQIVALSDSLTETAAPRSLVKRARPLNPANWLASFQFNHWTTDLCFVGFAMGIVLWSFLHF